MPSDRPQSGGATGWGQTGWGAGGGGGGGSSGGVTTGGSTGAVTPTGGDNAVGYTVTEPGQIGEITPPEHEARIPALMVNPDTGGFLWEGDPYFRYYQDISSQEAGNVEEVFYGAGKEEKREEYFSKYYPEGRFREVSLVEGRIVPREYDYAPAGEAPAAVKAGGVNVSLKPPAITDALKDTLIPFEPPTKFVHLTSPKGEEYTFAMPKTVSEADLLAGKTRLVEQGWAGELVEYSPPTTTVTTEKERVDVVNYLDKYGMEMQRVARYHPGEKTPYYSEVSPGSVFATEEVAKAWFKEHPATLSGQVEKNLKGSWLVYKTPAFDLPLIGGKAPEIPLYQFVVPVGIADIGSRFRKETIMTGGGDFAAGLVPYWGGKTLEAGKRVLAVTSPYGLLAEGQAARGRGLGEVWEHRGEIVVGGIYGGLISGTLQIPSLRARAKAQMPTAETEYEIPVSFDYKSKTMGLEREGVRGEVELSGLDVYKIRIRVGGKQPPIEVGEELPVDLTYRGLGRTEGGLVAGGVKGAGKLKLEYAPEYPMEPYWIRYTSEPRIIPELETVSEASFIKFSAPTPGEGYATWESLRADVYPIKILPSGMEYQSIPLGKLIGEEAGKIGTRLVGGKHTPLVFEDIASAGGQVIKAATAGDVVRTLPGVGGTKYIEPTITPTITKPYYLPPIYVSREELKSLPYTFPSDVEVSNVLGPVGKFDFVGKIRTFTGDLGMVDFGIKEGLKTGDKARIEPGELKRNREFMKEVGITIPPVPQITWIPRTTEIEKEKPFTTVVTGVGLMQMVGQIQPPATRTKIDTFQPLPTKTPIPPFEEPKIPGGGGGEPLFGKGDLGLKMPRFAMKRGKYGLRPVSDPISKMLTEFRTGKPGTSPSVRVAREFWRKSMGEYVPTQEMLKGKVKLRRFKLRLPSMRRKKR